MEKQPPIQMTFLEGESNIDEKKEYEYTIQMKNIKYKLIIIKDSENIQFKIVNLDNIQMHYYYNIYSLNKIIFSLQLNSHLYKNLDQIIEKINKAYSDNNISIIKDKKEFAKLKFTLIDEKSKKYYSILVLKKKDYEINEKFSILIDGVNSLKKEIKNKNFKDLEIIILDLKKSINEKMNQNFHIINSLKEKLKINEDLLKDNVKIIQSLKLEITHINEKFKTISKAKIGLKDNDSSKRNKTKLINGDEKEKNEIIKQNKNNSKIIEKKEEISNNPNFHPNKKKEENKIEIKNEYKMEKFFGSEEQTKYFFSIVMVGESKVGKSWIFDNYFSIPYTKSSSISLESEEVCIKLNEDILSINIGDCPGHESFNKIYLSIISNKDLIIFVYSIDNKNSFESLSKRIKEVKDNCKKETHFMLVGNKSDLNNDRLISKEEGNILAKNENFDYFIEVSAKTGENIDNIFFEAAKILYKNMKQIIV